MSKIKGVILAGGTGSRLFPLTKVTNKHLLPVGRKPMIVHAVDKFVEAGVTDIMVITGVEHMGDVVGLLGSGKDFACDFTYRVQDRAGGIAEALGLCRDFVGEDRCVVVLGDNIFQASLVPILERYRQQAAGARLLLKKVSDPQRFGVATIEDGKVTKIVEKPKEPETDLAVTGIYMYDAEVFRMVERLSPSARGELEITDVNNMYLDAGSLEYDFIDGYWTDAGTFPSWKRANDLVYAELGIQPGDDED
jgi:glucose-1-phosphate thymidylyltransferase